MEYKAGDILVITEGEYSDYTFHGPFRVLKELDQKEALKAFKKQFKPEHEWQTPSPGHFMAWLATSGYIADMESHQWHVGSYGDLNVDSDLNEVEDGA